MGRSRITEEGLHTHDMTGYQDVYFGGPHGIDRCKTSKNEFVMSPLKSFIKIKKTVQLIGNSQLKLKFKNIDSLERHAMIKYHMCQRLPDHTCIHTNITADKLLEIFLLYEKKQERFLNKVTNITNNKRLRKIERRIMETPGEAADDKSEGSARFVRRKRKKVIAKRRGMGSYMKRLKLASDSLKNTDPELGTVLNMDSILAFQGGPTKKTKVTKKGRGRGGRREGMTLSQTEHTAVQMSAQQAVWKMPRWKVENDRINPLMTDVEIEMRKNELFNNIENVHSTLSIEKLLAAPRRRGFRPSRILDDHIARLSLHEKKPVKKTAPVNLFTTTLALVTPSKEIPASISRRQMAESNKIFQLSRKMSKLNIDEEISLLASYAGLTRSTYLRGDDDVMVNKRKEYNQQLEKLYRRKLNLKRKWINVMASKRSSHNPGQTEEVPLPRNAPMMPLIPGFQQRIDRANNKRPTKVHAAADEHQRSTRRTSSILHDIMKMLPVEEHGSHPTTPPGSEREALPPIKPKLSIVQYQDAMNLPKMGPAARKAAIERNPSVKKVSVNSNLSNLSRQSSKEALPPINQARGPRQSVRRRGTMEAPDLELLLASQSMPLLPEQIKPQNGRIRRRSLTAAESKEDLLGLNISSSSSSGSSLKNQKEGLGLDQKEVDVGFKMNIFLSGLSNNEFNDSKLDQAVL